MNYLGLWFNTFVQKKQPISLIHLITRRCNARCKHCFIDFEDPLPPEDELSTEEIARLTKTFGDGLFSVYIAGGEPFLRKDIFEIVSAYCRDTAVDSVNIATNGMHTEAVGRFIERFLAAGLGKRLMLSISIDNFEAQHDSARRAPGLYKKAVATYKLIESFNDKKIIPTVAITVTPYNCANVADVYRFLKTSGIRAFSAILMREQGVVKAIEGKRQVLKAHGELVRLIEADQFRGATVGNGGDLLGCYVNARNNVFNRLLPEIYLTRGKSFNCSAGTLFGVIFPNGDVCPCEVQERFIMGNLREYKMDFMKLWNSGKARTIYRKMKKEKCACTFDGTWAVNILSNIGFLPQLCYYFIKNILLFLNRRRNYTPTITGSASQ
jgi:MoaA/NifB/PqqE/SkfB family radical SAM enzyme